MKIQKYKHSLPVSYTLGATLTYELIKCRSELVNKVYISSSLTQTDGIENLLRLCENKGISVEQNDKAFNILSPKGNCYVIAEFKKVSNPISEGSHIVLVNPSDAGNLGTIIRTATGFGITDIAIIRPAVDFFDPHTIRASMGAAFHVNVEYFNDIADYIHRFPQNNRFAFMLTASTPITDINIDMPFSLIFGNEATGLPDEYSHLCKSVIIKHSDNIDSLNLPMAAGIAMYEFTKNYWRNYK